MAEKAKRPPQKPEKKEGGKAAKQGLIIGFIVVLLGINVFQLYVWYGQKKQKEQDDAMIAEQQLTIKEKTTAIDSLRIEIQARIETINELNGDVTELEEALKELEILNAKLKKDKGRAAHYFRKWKEMKEQYEPMLRSQDERIAELTAQARKLDELNSNLKDEKKVLQGEVKDLEAESSAKTDSIKLAQVLQADKFKVTAVKKNGKEKYADLYKTSWLGKAKIEYEVDRNPVAMIGQRDFFIQVNDPSGATLKDKSGGGEFSADGKKLFYSLKDSFNYTKTKVWRTIYFESDTEYTSGEYTINIYCEGRKIGSGSFKVK